MEVVRREASITWLKRPKNLALKEGKILLPGEIAWQ